MYDGNQGLGSGLVWSGGSADSRTGQDEAGRGKDGAAILNQQHTTGLAVFSFGSGTKSHPLPLFSI